MLTPCVRSFARADLERIGKPETVLREQTLLCNPRMPAATLRSTATVDGSVGGVVLPDGSNAAELRPAGRALVSRMRSEYASTKILKLSSVPPDYRAILSAGQVGAFESTMRGYGGLWCCNRPPGGRGAGHIWYDFLHDIIPHNDRFQRHWSSTWTPKMGP
jgi:hypothetical protein